MTDTYDLIAIGAGPAGESATELASFFGHRSAVIEKNKPGGTVTTTGGAPTKTLREAALYFSGFCEGDVYGLRMSAPPEVATDIIRKRTWSVCELLQKVTADNIAIHNVDYIQGTARLDAGDEDALRLISITEGGGQFWGQIGQAQPDLVRLHFIQILRLLLADQVVGHSLDEEGPPLGRRGLGRVVDAEEGFSLIRRNQHVGEQQRPDGERVVRGQDGLAYEVLESDGAR